MLLSDVYISFQHAIRILEICLPTKIKINLNVSVIAFQLDSGVNVNSLSHLPNRSATRPQARPLNHRLTD